MNKLLTVLSTQVTPSWLDKFIMVGSVLLLAAAIAGAVTGA